MLLEVCKHHSGHVLDSVFKAESEDPSGIWEPHQNPYIRRIVELFTRRGLDRIAGVRSELESWLAGKHHHGAHERPHRPSGNMARWSETELALVKLYLQSLTPDQFSYDDWGLLVDYLAQRYLPADDMRAESEWLASRSNLMGRMAAARGETSLTPARVDDALSAITDQAARIRDAVVDYGSAHCAENVVAFTDGMRHRLKRTVMEHVQRRTLGETAPADSALSTRLLDDFGTLNRDWRRIAVTEAGEIANQGMILGLKPGSRVKRVEKYEGACSFCRSIDGKVMTVVSADAPDKDGATQVWAGKSNVGRAASPRRVDGSDRPPEERWWIAAGTQHPNCRGRWVHLAEPARPSDPALSAWMDEYLGRT